jgi:hypothetical protein
LLLWTTLAAAAWLLLTPMMRYPFEAGWDETFYLAQASSFAYDLDYDAANDLFHTKLVAWVDDRARYSTVDFQMRLSEEARLLSQFAVGCSLVWVPGIWLGNLLGLGGESGFTHTSRLGPGVAGFLGYWSAFLAGLTVFGAYALARSFRLGARASAAAAAICLVATPLAFWSFRAPGYSHLADTFAVTLFLLACRRYGRRRGATAAAAVGLAGGLAYIARWSSVVFLVVGLGVWLRWLLRELRSGARLPRRSPIEAAAGFAACIAVALFQWCYWKFNYGRWITIPQGADFMHWDDPRWGHLFYSTYNSFLPWAPAVLMAIPGLVFWARGRRFWGGLFVLALGLNLWIAAVSGDVQGGWSFGQRRLTSLYPILTVGMAHALRLMRVDRRRWTCALSVAVAFAAGLFLIRLRETGVNDLLVSWRESEGFFGDNGPAAIGLMLRSDLMDGLNRGLEDPRPLAAGFGLLALLVAVWIGAARLIRLGLRRPRLRLAAVWAPFVLAVVAHAVAIPTDGRDDPESRAILVELVRATRDRDLERSARILQSLRGRPKFELQGSILLVDAASRSRRFDLAVAALAPVSRDSAPDALLPLADATTRMVNYAGRSDRRQTPSPPPSVR